MLGDKSSGVAVAIVQSGVASAEELRQFDALGSMYHEPLWVFYRGEKSVNRLAELAGKRIGVGPPGSGTHAIARQLLAINGLIESDFPRRMLAAVLVEDSVAAAATALQKGELDAAFFVAAFEADYIQRLLNDPNVVCSTLTSTRHITADSDSLRRYAAHGNGQSGPKHSRPRRLGARTDGDADRSQGFSPGLVPLLLMTATRIHGGGDELSSPVSSPRNLSAISPSATMPNDITSRGSRCCSGCSRSGWPHWSIGPR